MECAGMCDVSSVWPLWEGGVFYCKTHKTKIKIQIKGKCGECLRLAGWFPFLLHPQKDFFFACCVLSLIRTL